MCMLLRFLTTQKHPQTIQNPQAAIGSLGSLWPLQRLGSHEFSCYPRPLRNLHNSFTFICLCEICNFGINVKFKGRLSSPPQFSLATVSGHFRWEMFWEEARPLQEKLFFVFVTCSEAFWRAARDSWNVRWSPSSLVPRSFSQRKKRGTNMTNPFGNHSLCKCAPARMSPAPWKRLQNVLCQI